MLSGSILRPIMLPLAVVLLGGSSCGLWTLDEGPQYGRLLKSDKERDTRPSVSEAELAALAEGNTAFSWELYQQVRLRNGNQFYSPYCISFGLAMAYAGARGHTALQMAEEMHFGLSQDRLHPTFNALDLRLSASSGAGAADDGEGFQLLIRDSVWGQEGYSFLPSYLDVLAEHYGAGLRVLDFRSDPKGARLIINRWASDATGQRVQELVAPGVVSSATRLVLTNAAYFRASWEKRFPLESTREGPFQPLESSMVTVPMMSQTAAFPYLEEEGYKALRLDYAGGEAAMLILLPAVGAFADFEGTLNQDRMDAILADLTLRVVELTLPKFAYEAGLPLGDVLRGIGVPDAMCGGMTDFSGIDGMLGTLCISEVAHSGYVQIDENGTEATAAGDAVTDGASAVPDRPEELVQFSVDHPFIFVIHDAQTGTVLFIGRVVNAALSSG
ncbi:MAG: serpin family protein [Phycisphaerales bacterium]|nr:MAG: serpin family protein [Phycisphaerales bacterium]